MDYERAAILSDPHGYADLVGRAIDHYGNDVQYVFNGDIPDRGPDTKGTYEHIKQLGESATLLFGNHCWTQLAALTDADPERRALWIDEKWLHPTLRKIIENEITFKSYGIGTYSTNLERANALRDVMRECGHLALLESSQLYLETDDMLVIHAGADDGRSWAAQRRDLDATQALAQAHIFDSEPPQISDFRLCDVDYPPKDIHQKMLITGHSHSRAPANQRVYRRGIHPIRVRLASHLQDGDPLFVYETWTQQVRQFDQ